MAVNCLAQALNLIDRPGYLKSAVPQVGSLFEHADRLTLSPKQKALELIQHKHVTNIIFFIIFRSTHSVIRVTKAVPTAMYFYTAHTKANLHLFRITFINFDNFSYHFNSLQYLSKAIHVLTIAA